MNILLGLVLVLGVSFGLSALGAWIFMSLWNYVAVGTFHAPTLGFWPAFAVLMLLSFVKGVVRIKESK